MVSRGDVYPPGEPMDICFSWLQATSKGLGQDNEQGAKALIKRKTRRTRFRARELWRGLWIYK